MTSSVRTARGLFVCLLLASLGMAGGAQSPATITVSTSPNPSWAAEAVALTAVVSGQTGTTVDFSVDGVVVGSAPIGSARGLGNEEFASSQTMAIATGDFNGDGRADAAYAGTGGVVVVTSNSDGTPGTATTLITGSYTSIATADFNDDGRLDLIAGSSSQVRVWLGAPNGAFSSGTIVMNGFSCCPIGGNVQVADLSGDSTSEIIVTDPGNSVRTVYTYSGGGVASGCGSGGAGGNHTSFVDVNGDGRRDIVTADPNQGLRVRWNAGNCTFNLETEVIDDLFLKASAAADLNGDGRVDLVVLDSDDSTSYVDSLRIFKQNANGTFAEQPAISLPTGFEGRDLTLAHLDEDGLLDLAVTVDQKTSSNGTASLRIYRGLGTGEFGLSATRSLRWRSGRITTADLNGDGELDLLVGIDGGTSSPRGVSRFRTVMQSQATFTTATMAGGSHQVTAKVDGVQSAAVTHVVNDGTLNLSWSFSANTPQPGQPVSMSVTWPSVTPVPTGFITVRDGSTILRTIDMATSARPVDFTAQLSIGSHSLVATYTGDRNYNGTTQTRNITVPKLQTSTMLVASPAVSYHGDTVTLVATPSSWPNASPQAGIVDFTGVGATISKSLEPVPGLLAPAVQNIAASSITSADLNGDGAAEIIVGGGNTLTVWSKPAGATQYQQSSSIPFTGPNTLLETADLDRDGFQDVIAVSGSQLRTLRGKGDGTFHPVVSVNTVGIANSIALSDRNGDGVLDITLGYLQGSGATGLELRLGVGNGSFGASATQATGGAVTGLTSADVNNDGRADLIVAVQTFNLFEYVAETKQYIANTANGLGAPTVLSTGGEWADVATGDLNGDGQADLVVAQEGTMVVRFGSTSGLQPAVTNNIGFATRNLTFADVDGDGDQDLVVTVIPDAGSFNLQIGVIENDGGALGLPVLFEDSNVSSNPVKRLLKLDLEGDGKQDIVLSVDNTLRIYRGGVARAAIATLSTLAVGTYQARAQFKETAEYDDSYSDFVPFQVIKRQLPMTLSSTPNPSVLGQSVTLTANVSGTAGYSNLYVDFAMPGLGLGTAQVINGTATLTTTQMKGGTNAVSATLSGHSIVEGSAQLTHTVSKADSIVTLKATRQQIDQHDPVTFIANAKPAAGFNFTATGQIEFMVDGALVATAPLLGGTATWTAESLRSGVHEVYARYAGDSSFTASESTRMNVGVTSGPACKITTSPNPSLADAAVAVSITCQTNASVVKVRRGSTEVASLTLPQQTGPSSFMRTASGTLNTAALSDGANALTADGGALPYTHNVHRLKRVVTSLADNGNVGTLRWAVNAAQPGDLITFAVNGTIALTSTLIIDTPLRIAGPGSDFLTIDGQNSRRHFIITADATISGLRLVNGTALGGSGGSGYAGGGGGAGLGGSIFVSGANTNVHIQDVAFTNNRAIGGTGGGVSIAESGSGGGGGAGGWGQNNNGACGGNGGTGVLGSDAGLGGGCGHAITDLDGADWTGGGGAGFLTGSWLAGNGGFGGGGGGGLSGDGGFAGGGGGEGYPDQNGTPHGVGGEWGGSGGTRGNRHNCVNVGLFEVCTPTSDYYGGAGGGGGGLGGAIFVHSGSLAVVNAVFAFNQAIGGERGATLGTVAQLPTNGHGGGSAIFSRNQSVSLTDVFYLANTVTNPLTVLGTPVCSDLCGAPASNYGAMLHHAGGGESAELGSAFATPLQVKGVAVPNNWQVTFALPADGLYGTFADGSVVAQVNVTGAIATAPAIIANGRTGAFDVTVTSPSAAAPITFRLLNLPRTGTASTTTTQLVLPSNPSKFSAQLLFNANVSPASTQAARTEFLDGYRYLGVASGPTTAATMFLQTNGLRAGLRPVRAIYRGDDTLQHSLSSPAWQMVRPLGSSGFTPPITANAGHNPTAMITANLRGLSQELITTAPDGIRIRHSVEPSSATDFIAIPTVPLAVAAGEFSGDERSDLVVLDSTRQLRLLVQTTTAGGGTTFVPGATYSIQFDGAALTVSDVNLDGYSDVIVPMSGQRVHVRLGRPGGGLSGAIQSTAPAGGTGLSPVIEDFDDDGLPDLAYVTGTGTLVVMRGLGTGEFEPTLAHSFGTLLTRGKAVDIADFNLDGRPDLALGGGFETSIGAVITVLDPLGARVVRQVPTGQGDVNGLAVADFDGEGVDEIAFTKAGSNWLTVFPVEAWGAVLEERTYELGAAVNAFVVTDINNDNVVDVIAGRTAGNTQSLLYGLWTKSTQTITGGFCCSVELNQPIDFNLEASSDLAVTLTVISGSATVNGRIVTPTALGTIVIRATQTGNDYYFPVTRDFTLELKSSQTITFAGPGNKTYLDAPVTLSATASSSLPVTFSLVSGPATVVGTTLTINGAGTVVVRASQAGNALYHAAPNVDRTITVAKAAQTITFGTLPDRTYLAGGPYTLTATASSQLGVTFSVVSGPATIAGNQMSITGGGQVVIRASQAGNNNYLAAPDVERSFNVAKANQTINFAALPNRTYLDAPFDLAASASSNLGVSFSLVSGPATLAGTKLTMTGAGTVVVRATQPGDSNFNAATPVERSFDVAKANQTITFAALANRTYLDAPFALSASASSSLDVVFSIVSGPATLAGNTVTITGAGTVVVRATQVGDGNYNAAPVVDRSFAVAKADQAISFAALANRTYLDAPFTLSASASSNLDVAFSIVSGPATLAGNTLTITGAGTVVVRATQAGDSNYNAAPAVDRSFDVAKADQSISFAALANHAYLDAPFALTASASSSLDVAFSIVSGPATLAGNSLTITGAGTVVVRAAQVGDGNYNAAPAVDRSFDVAKADQSITFAALPDINYGATPFALVATSASGGAVAFAVTGPALLTGTTLTITASGTVTITASQAGDANYNAAPDVTRSFAVARVPLTVTATSSSRVYGTANPMFIGTVVGAVNGDIFNATYSSAAGLLTNIGGHAIVPSIEGAQLGSYDVTIVNGTLTITKASITVAAASAARGYWDAAPVYSGTISGVVSGDAISPVYSSPATASSAAGTYPVIASLADPDGRLSNYDVTNTSATLTISNPLPVIGALTPASVAAGVGDTWIDVTGQDFVPQSIAKWNGVTLDTTFESRTKLRARVPAAQLAAQTVAYVTVSSAVPGGGVTAPAAFFVNASGAPVSEVETASAINGTASVSVGGNGPGTPGSVTVTAQGTGTITTAQYNGNPGTPTAFRTSGDYFDVFVAPGSAWSSLTVTTCKLTGGNNVFWYNGSRWIRVTPQSFDASTGCVTMTFSATSSPSIADLTGTYFAVAIDFVAPVTTATASNGYAFGHWTNQAVTVALNAADNADGVGLALLNYSASGAVTVPATADADGAATIAVNIDGDTVIRYSAVDQSGNTEAESTRQVRLDRVTPAATASASPRELWSPNGKMVPVTLSGRITDDRSGIASASYRVTDEYGAVQPAGTLSVQADGQFSIAVPLEASRKGTDKDGRLYTITVETRDRAGNASTATTTVLVPHNK